MRPQTMMVVVLALVFGGSAATGVNTYMRNQRSGPRSDMTPVVVATVDIPRGGMITEDHVRVREMPTDQVHPDAISTVEDALERTAFIPMVAGEPVLMSKLSDKGQGGLSHLVPRGMRAFTIQTTTASAGVAGFLLPGNRVDVLLTIDDMGRQLDGSGGTTTTLLQNVEVLAVGQRIDTPSEHKVDLKEMRSVTLLVTPDQAAKLDLGQNKGTLHLALRNLDDHEPAVTSPATMRQLRGYQEAPARPWDERAKGLLDAFGKALAESGATRQAEKPEPEMKPEPAPEPVLAQQPAVVPRNTGIRTLRGNREGFIPVTIFEPVGSAVPTDTPPPAPVVPGPPPIAPTPTPTPSGTEGGGRTGPFAMGASERLSGSPAR